MPIKNAIETIINPARPGIRGGFKVTIRIYKGGARVKPIYCATLVEAQAVAAGAAMAARTLGSVAHLDDSAVDEYAV